MEKKIEEAEQELAATRALTAKYLPLDPSTFIQSLQDRRIDLEDEPTGGNALVINGYVKSKDQLILDFDTATLQLRRITVKSYFSSPSENVHGSRPVLCVGGWDHLSEHYDD